MKKIYLPVACLMLFCGCYNTIPVDSVRDEAVAESAMVNGMTKAKKALRRAVSPAAAASGGADRNTAFFKESSRMMAYTSGFTLMVKNREEALDEVKKLAEKLGGYLLDRHQGSMELKVPVKKADEFLQMVRKIGKFSNFRLSATDLTDTITDLDVRLENLRKLRQRLTELLNRTTKVEELLKVEKELNRVTTEIERIDAQLQNNRNRVANVTFEVFVIEEHGAVPDGTPLAVSRFPFLKALSSTAAGTEDKPFFSLAVPAGFVPVKQGAAIDSFAATSSDDCIWRTWERRIPGESDLEFWKKLVTRALSSLHHYDQIKTFPATLGGKPACRITAQVRTGRGIQLYMALISVDRFGFDELQIVEFFGPQEAFKKHESKVLEAVR